MARAKPKSIVAHPLLPAVVALWFGALFGLGSLAMGSETLERGVLALGLDTMVPAFAPPIGIAFRIVLALVLAAAGAGIGFALARRVAGRDAVPASPTTAPADEADPLPVTPGILLGRRRGLAATETDFAPYEAAPLPGGLPQILDITALDPTEPIRAAFLEPEPDLELDAFVEAATFEPEVTAERPMPTDATEVLAGDPAALGTVQLAERLALALQGRRERRAAAQAEQGAAEFTLTAPPLPDLGFHFNPIDPAKDDEEEDEFAEHGEGHNYGSLLGLAPSASIRDDEAAPEPVVIFPGQIVREPAIPGDPAQRGLTSRASGATEEALREALAKLQRLSGAA